MGTHYIDHACGHQEKHILKVAQEKRGYAEDLAYDSCSKCKDAVKQAAKQAARAKETAAAKEAARRHSLPELQGSEKQVAWAEQLRGRLLKAWEELKQQKEEDVPDAVKAHIEKILRQKQAKYFIDNWRTVEGFRSADLEKELIEGSPDEISEAMFGWY